MKNKEIIDWYKSLQNKGVHVVAAEFRNSFHDFQCTDGALLTKISRLVQSSAGLSRKRKKEELKKLHDSDFAVPIPQDNLQRAQSACNTSKEKHPIK